MSVHPEKYIPGRGNDGIQREMTSTNQVGKKCKKCGCNVRGSNHADGTHHQTNAKAKR
jgi:hypothetical protein